MRSVLGADLQIGPISASRPPRYSLRAGRLSHRQSRETSRPKPPNKLRESGSLREVPKVRIHLPPAGSQERTPHRRSPFAGYVCHSEGAVGAPALCDITRFTKAKIFSEIGKQTPILPASRLSPPSAAEPTPRATSAALRSSSIPRRATGPRPSQVGRSRRRGSGAARCCAAWLGERLARRAAVDADLAIQQLHYIGGMSRRRSYTLPERRQPHPQVGNVARR